MCPSVLLKTSSWFRSQQESDSNNINSSQTVSDFSIYQKQVLESLSNNKNNEKVTRIKKKLCSLFSNESSQVNNYSTSLNYLLETLARHSKMVNTLNQFRNFLDNDIFDFDRNCVEFDFLECKTDIWSERYNSCLEVNANSKYLLSMNCKLCDIELRGVNFEFSNMTFKIDYCQQQDVIDFQVEMKGKMEYCNDGRDELGKSAKAVWNGKFIVIVNETKLFNLSSENPLKDFNDIMTAHYGIFKTNMSFENFSQMNHLLNMRREMLMLNYCVKFNNYLQLENDCLYHGSAQLDFRPGDGVANQKNEDGQLQQHQYSWTNTTTTAYSNTTTTNTTAPTTVPTTTGILNAVESTIRVRGMKSVQLQHIQFNYFTVKKKKPFVTVEIDNISYLDVCKIIYSDECVDKSLYQSLADFIGGYNCLANDLRGYLIYSKGSSATLNYKGVGKFIGWCPPGLFTFKRNKEGDYKSVFKPSTDENGKFPEIFGFGKFKFHRNRLYSTNTVFYSLDELLVQYFITNSKMEPILSFESLRNNVGGKYSVIPSNVEESQNGHLTGMWSLMDKSETNGQLICDFMINGSLNIASVDLKDYGKIWMRPKHGNQWYDFLNRLFLKSYKCILSDLEILSY